MAKLRSLLISSFQIKNNEIPIKMYSIVQTGPKIQFGGLNEGLFKVAYHSGTDCAVNIPAILPRPKGTIMDTISFIICNLLMRC